MLIEQRLCNIFIVCKGNVNVNVNVGIYITTEGFKTMTNSHRRLTGLGRE